MKVTSQCIVCATDFSENARRAADVAAAIALRLRCSLVLVHVTDQPDALGKRTNDLRIVMRKARAQLRKEVLEAAIASALRRAPRAIVAAARL